MNQHTDTGEQHLALSTAAAVIYRQITGTTAQIASAEDFDEALNVVARAIANVAPIWTADRPSGVPRQLAPIELIHCNFARGATLLVTGFGVEYRHLTIRRADMRAALAILKGAGVDFTKRR